MSLVTELASAKKEIQQLKVQLKQSKPTPAFKRTAFDVSQIASRSRRTVQKKASQNQLLSDLGSTLAEFRDIDLKAMNTFLSQNGVFGEITL